MHQLNTITDAAKRILSQPNWIELIRYLHGEYPCAFNMAEAFKIKGVAEHVNYLHTRERGRIEDLIIPESARAVAHQLLYNENERFKVFGIAPVVYTSVTPPCLM